MLSPVVNGLWGKVLVLAVPAAVGTIVYFVIARLFRLSEADLAFDLVLRRKGGAGGSEL